MDKYLSYWQNEVSIEEFSGHHDRRERNGRISEIIHLIDNNNSRYSSSPWSFRKSKTILDCGAGLGHIYNFCKENNLEYQGLELTPKFVEHAVAKGIPMILGDIENIPYEDNSYDVCVAFDVLNHLYDYRTAISEMIRVADKAVVITFFKPSVEAFNYIFPETRKFVIGWYPGEWDTGNLPITCPYLGFYPGRCFHSKRIALMKKYKIYNSSLGFYVHYNEDESGQPTCISHYFKYSKLFSFIETLSRSNNEVYVTEHIGQKGASENYKNSVKEDATPPLKYFADTFIIKKTGVRHG